MYRRAAAVSIPAMTTRRRRALSLELDETDGDSIAGRLADEAGVRTEFTGWIGLAAAIDDALEGGLPVGGPVAEPPARPPLAREDGPEVIRSPGERGG
jgi:hypothetical protein